MLTNYPENKIKNFTIALLAGCSFISSLNLTISCGLDIITAFYAISYLLKHSKKPFATGYVFGLGYFGCTLYWIAESFKCVGIGSLGYPAVACLVLYLSLFPAFAFYATKRLYNNELTLAIYFASFWTISEFLRGILFTGFPWNLLAYVTVDYPYFPQIADLFGSYGVSFLVALISMLSVSKKYWKFGVKIVLCVLTYGAIKVSIWNKTDTNMWNSNITLVQPSISQVDKMNPKRFQSNLDSLIYLSNFNKSQNHPRLVIWPEAAVSLHPKNEAQILNYIASFIRSDKTYLLFGCDHFEEGILYNGAYLINNLGTVIQSYDKRHLLPFGEFIPDFLKFFGFRKMTEGVINFSKGSNPRTFYIKGFEDFDLLICYEAVFPGEISDSKACKWVINITNDAWFGDTPGPLQHLNSVRFRAIEEQKTIIRVANNGISCVINPLGTVTKRLSLNEIGTIELE